jgi:hypothetical protein
MNTVQSLTSIFNNLIKWGSICFVVWCFYLSISALAGKTTLANILIKVLSNLSINNALCLLLAGGGVAYGLGERKVRQKAIQHIQPRNQELEKKLDPNRTSSELTPRGETNPRDE